MKPKSLMGALFASLALFAGGEISGMADQEFKIPVWSYYSDKNLKDLNKKGIRKHAPLKILIDQYNSETPDEEKTEAVTQEFSYALQAGFFPIVVSQSIAYNYLVRKRDKRWQDNVSFDQWKLFDIPDTQFLLFMPKRYLTYYQPHTGFNLRKLSYASHLLKDPYRSLISWLKKTKAPKSPKFYIRDFEKLFVATNEKKQPIWDIIFSGHGSYDPIHIGGLAPSDMQQILTFFARIPTATFYLASCYAGGKNIDLLQFEKAIDNRYIKPLNYILIVGGITDTPTVVERDAQQFYHGFFDLAAKREGKGKMLDNLLVEINRMNLASGSPHGTTNIPQVWLPGGLGFQTFNIDKRVASLGPVKVRVHEEENKPINLPNTTRAVLVYTGSIKAPIKAGLAQFHEKMTPEAREKELDLRRMITWANQPNIRELLYSLKEETEKANKKEFPLINQLNAKGIFSEDKIHEDINF